MGTHGLGSTPQRPQIRNPRFVDRRRHRHDDEPAFPQDGGIGAEVDIHGLQVLGLHLEGAVQAVTQFRDPLCIQVKAHHVEMACQVNGQRQADIT